MEECKRLARLGSVNQGCQSQNSSQTWKIQNLLPFAVYVYAERKFTGEKITLGEIHSLGTAVFHSQVLRDGDELFVYTQSNQLLHPLVLPYTVHGHIRDIRIGGVEYSEAAGSAQNSSLDSDVSGLLIHNMLRIPLDIYFRSRDSSVSDEFTLVAQVGAYDGRGYHGGSGGIMFFDNDRDGLRIGDQIGFGFSLTGLSRKPAFWVTIHDNHAHHLYVGKVVGGYRGPHNDIYAHDIDRTVTSGYTWYVPMGNGETYKTHPWRV